MPDEKIDEKAVFSAEDNFRVQVFNVVVDQINQSMATRFSDQKRLYQDLSCFDARRFPELKNGVPENALEKICALIPTIDKEKLKEELESFIDQWLNISSTLKDSYLEQEEKDSQTGSEDESAQTSICEVKKSCI